LLQFLAQSPDHDIRRLDSLVGTYRLWHDRVLPHPDILNAFKLSLSPPQLISHRLLEEWVSGWYEDPEFDKAARLALDNDETDDEYHNHLANLYKKEFSGIPEKTRDNLARQLLAIRRSAAQYASCRAMTEACKRVIDQGTQPTQSALFGPRRTIPVHIQPCPWLNVRDDNNSLPYYLWDVRNERTRETTSLIREYGKCPEYTAISHTWGRWKLDLPWISLPGVPWKIPPNSRFRVADLPEILKRSPFDFVWLDLLTIPQEESSPAMLALQKTEISRQALIFRTASNAIAWFNDVKDWKAVEGALEWICLKFIKLRQTKSETLLSRAFKYIFVRSDTDKRLATAYKAANNFNPLWFNYQKRRFEPNPWFTSLWTLQEICLRPDMYACNENWVPIKLVDGTPISFAEIVALFWCVDDSAGRSKFRFLFDPRGVTMLHSTIWKSGLNHILDLSRPVILNLGSRRQCTERRAEAIMSAVGATNWFDTSAAPREQEMSVHGYPLAFLNEVRGLVGSALFLGSRPPFDFDEVLVKYYRDAKREGQLPAVGSLLPFGGTFLNMLREEEIMNNMMEHPALDGWILEESGAVRISQVGMIRSENIANDHTYLIGPTRQSNWTKISIQEDICLHQWLRSCKPEMPNFAVCIVESTPLREELGFDFITFGIVLKELRPGIFLRIAQFQMKTDTRPVVESRSVEWLVL
jgi:hypothetical protein